jgi:pyruvate-formate lyase-activating enzyme
MLFADEEGHIFDHPELLALGRSGELDVLPSPAEWIPLPDMSRLFFLPNLPPRGLDPQTGRVVTLRTQRLKGQFVRCWAVAAFLEPGYVRILLPAAEALHKDYALPLWAYTAVGLLDYQYVTTAFPIEYQAHWDPRGFDDREMLPRLKAHLRRHKGNPLLRHLSRCATENHCFAAKNLFLRRGEAPLPVSRQCNARCLGCLSDQPYGSCLPSHARISFRPEVEHISEIAVPHLQRAPQPIVSFGQGCEGEPLTEATLIGDAIHQIRERTERGTINLNTNGSIPDRLMDLAAAGLDSVRVSLNSVRPDLFHAYVRPIGFSFKDVERSLVQCSADGVFTMINYLVFPGISDQEEEVEHLLKFIRRTGVNFVHLKNLCIDPDLYFRSMPRGGSPCLGIPEMVHRIRYTCPSVGMGYFNQSVRSTRV